MTKENIFVYVTFLKVRLMHYVSYHWTNY